MNVIQWVWQCGGVDVAELKLPSNIFCAVTYVCYSYRILTRSTLRYIYLYWCCIFKLFFWGWGETSNSIKSLVSGSRRSVDQELFLTSESQEVLV